MTSALPLYSALQDMEKHGRLILCVNELHQMLKTPIKPYSPAEQESKTKRKRRRVKAGSPQPKPESEATSGEENDEDSSSGSSCCSPSASPRPQRSSSDGGSDLDELLAKDFPHEDLPSLITRALGKGVCNAI